MPAPKPSTATQQAFIRRALAELGLSQPKLAERLSVDLAKLRAWLRAPHHPESKRMPLRLQQKLRGLLKRQRLAQRHPAQDTPEHWQRIKQAKRQIVTGTIHAVRLDGELRFYQLTGGGRSKTFSCRRCGSPQRALVLARAQAEAWGVSIGSGITGQPEGRVRVNSPTSSAGFSLVWKDRPSGPILHVRCSRQEPGGRTQENMFSVERHGLAGALDQAIAFRVRYGAPQPDRSQLLRELQAAYRSRARQLAEAKTRNTDRHGAPRGRSATGAAGINAHWRSSPQGALMYIAGICADGQGGRRGGMYSVKRWGLQGALDQAIHLRTRFGAPCPDKRALLKTLREIFDQGPPSQ